MVASALVASSEPLARLGIGGPIDGKVITSSSAMLHWGRPTRTLTIDDVYGVDVRDEFNEVDTYHAKTVVVLGVRAYRIWIMSDQFLDFMTAEGGRDDLEAEVLLRLIDAAPEDVASCRERRYAG